MSYTFLMKTELKLILVFDETCYLAAPMDTFYIPIGAAGISYFLKYRSFHAELEDDFHDYEDEDEFDGSLPHDEEPAVRNYVPLGEKKEEASEAGEESAKAASKEAEDMAGEASEAVKETVSEDAGKAEETSGATTIVEDNPAD